MRDPFAAGTLIPRRAGCRPACSLLVLFLLATVPSVPLPLPAGALPPRGDFDGHTKREVMIPMRDGIRLFTTIYQPKDRRTSAPILITRTPYSCAPYGEDRFPAYVSPNYRRYLEQHYILVFQDVRGRYMSEGTFENVRPYRPVKRTPREIDESSDAYDTIDWLLEHLEDHNGRAGVLGLSYGGFYASMSAIDAHPALKAVAPTAPVSTWMGGDDFFHNGAFLLPHAFNFFAEFGWPRPAPKSTPDRSFDHGTSDEYDFFLRLGPLGNANARYFHDSVAFWNTLTAHPTWDAFWAERDILPHLRNLRPAMLFVGGWFDTENLYGALQSYIANEAQSPGAENRLVMGPWSHGQWWDGDGSALGKVSWGSKTSRFYIDSIEVPFFDNHLRETPSAPMPEAWVFNTGANVWRRLDHWPPKGLSETRLYLSADRRLSFSPPSETGELFDEFFHDPASPVPYTDVLGRWYSRGFMVEDQRFVADRKDVLTYTSAPLTEDLTAAGPLQVALVAATSGTDADWVVKLIDVFPDAAREGGMRGYQMLLRGDVMRGKFRKSLEQPEPLVPNEPASFRFDMNDVFHTFRKGHRIMVQVQSTWFPMIDRNPGKFVDIFRAKATDYQRTRQRVYRSATHPSYLGVTVLR